MRTDRDFARRVLHAGARVTWATVAASLLYLSATPDGPHRGWLLAISLVAAVDAAVMTYVARRRLLPDDAVEPVLFGWNVAHVAATVAACALDGGASSPYSTIFFLSVAYAAVALPRGQVVVLAALGVAALGLLAAIADGGLVHDPSLILRAGVLLVLAAVCSTIAGDRAANLDAIRESREEMLRRLARVVEYRDTDTGGHLERMSAYSELIAGRLGFDVAERRRLHLAAAMHDVGKVAVPDAVLLKPGRLTPGERAVMERHAEIGHEMLSGSGSDLLDLAATIALTHHERFDGEGYPRRLRGEDIPLVGRIVAVADVFDALTSDRVYKRAMPIEEAVAIVVEGRGTQFDPRVVDAFLAELDAIRAVRERYADAPARRPAPEPVAV